MGYGLNSEKLLRVEIGGGVGMVESSGQMEGVDRP